MTPINARRGRHRRIEKLVFLYHLIDPRDGKVRYVGISTNPLQRLRQRGHRLDPGPSSPWVRELRAAGLQPALRIIGPCGDDPDSDEAREIVRLLDAGEPLLNILNCRAGPRRERSVSASIDQQTWEKLDAEARQHRTTRAAILRWLIELRYLDNPPAVPDPTPNRPDLLH